MTTLDVRSAAATRPPAATSRGRDLLASEWTKLRSVRSTYWTVLAAVATTIGVAAIVGNATASNWPKIGAAARAGYDPVLSSFDGIIIAQLAIGVLGVLAISSEHGTGLIRTTFAAVPQRRAVLAAKAAVVGAVCLVVGELTAFASFFVTQAFLSGQHIGVSLGSAGALRAVVCAGFYLFISGMVGLGLGAIIRHTAGAVAALFGLVFILQQVVSALPSPWDVRIGKFELPNAARSMSGSHQIHGLLSPGQSALVCAAWAVTVLVTAGLLITRRDA